MNDFSDVCKTKEIVKMLFIISLLSIKAIYAN
jgi:hypothetical protein